MASNDVEILDPAAPVEKVNENKSGYELDRRHLPARTSPPVRTSPLSGLMRLRFRTQLPPRPAVRPQ
jgi:hypothetical protein